ncbi:Putative uncharacterized protein [Moritella viscosa]|uniref:Uncharacterized protein n=1 Tax=Moritella viscosa TaxID=80854 RepID=A0A1K9YS62_9GAMM|nr:Putative uncharacterized protein [Moritella viscosa]SGY85314.1 Putative uncharacterized protein [Moritella viscosa]SHO24475.1 Putative uncharacterized protein [Moritella viscosa]
MFKMNLNHDSYLNIEQAHNLAKPRININARLYIVVNI